jgi:hypothetical protein
MLQVSAPTHPIMVCAHAIGAALDDVADLDPMFMATSDKRDALLAVGREVARLEALRLRLLASADDVAERDAARDPGAWLAHHQRTSPAGGRRDQALASALDQRYPLVAQAIGAGLLQREQAQVIVSALDDLPHEVGHDVLTLAESHLVDEAARFALHDLRGLGRTILSTVAPQIAEEHERKRLEEADERTAATTKLTIRQRGDGMSDLRARISDAAASRLLHDLHAYTNPRQPGNQQDTTAPEDRRPHSHRLGHAFVRLIEALDPRRLPMMGGDATTLMVTINLDALKNGIGDATLTDGTPVSIAQARRLACTAGWMPVVLGGASQLLDVGRLRRLYTGRARRAMAWRDKTCRSVGCDHPADWCEAHHKKPWAEGGKTDLADGVMLCPFHHDRVHDPRYDITYHPNGDVTFHRRA